jgi:hypothetical protein
MVNPSHEADTGVVVALLERMRTQRLPRLLDIKARVDAGATLDQGDIDFLGQVFHDANDVKPLLDRHPELNEIAGRLAHLYREITQRALANEGGTDAT